MQNNNENYQKFRQDMASYYKKTHKNILKLSKFTPSETADFLHTGLDNKYGSSARLSFKSRILKYLYGIEKSNVATACFKLDYDGINTIYAYVYAGVYDGIMQPKYICTGSTYQSQDGEYRSRFIHWQQFEEILTVYNDALVPIEEHLVTQINAKKLAYHVDFHCGEGDVVKWQSQINNERIAIKLHILCCLYDFRLVKNNIVPNHINDSYRIIVEELYDKSVLEKTIKLCGGNENFATLTLYLHSFTNKVTKNIEPLIDGCGQKILPLNNVELLLPHDILYGAWRELFFSAFVADLVLNLISPSFPMLCSWFYIHDTSALMFDNYAIHERYHQSSIADKIAQNLKIADKLAHKEAEPSEIINNKFKRVSKDIRNAVIHAGKDIQLSEYSINILSEYVGRTFHDMPSIIASNNKYKNIDKLFTDYNVFCKHIFEYNYACYSLNINGIIHGDAHMNNLTIYNLWAFADSLINPSAAYVVKNDAYVFPHYGIFSAMIDFSRGIFYNMDRLREEFDEQYITTYLADQNNRIMVMLTKYLPELVTDAGPKLRTLLDENFPIMFKIITNIDTYAIFSGINTIIKSDPDIKKINLAPGIADFIDKISTAAEKLLLNNLRAVIAGNIDDIEWPNLVLLRDHFENWRIGGPIYPTIEAVAAKNISIIDIFNSNNSMKYRVDDYEKWGPLMSVEHVEKKRAEYGLEPDHDLDDWWRHMAYDESVQLHNITANARAKDDVTLYEGWMFS